MIVVVEGPSAAGKTTWCRGFTKHLVPEYAPTGVEPDGSNPAVQAEYWVQVNSGRWADALGIERSTGLAVCDSDPLKPHYSWCLAVVGAAPWSRFEHELQQCRAAFAAGDLGFADLVMVSTASKEQLRRQKAADLRRRRRSFELHVRLREPLLTWYAALERMSPGRVLWSLPENGAQLTGTKPRPARSDPALIDALIDQLPMP